MSLLNLLINYRALELAFMFLLVWWDEEKNFPIAHLLTQRNFLRYYCTLTIRESILKVNGSRIKGWWRLHHFISTVCAAVLLIWPQGEPWQLFRTQFMCFNVYISECKFTSVEFICLTNLINRSDPVPPIWLSEGCSVSAQSTRRASWHGHHNRRIPHVDVEGSVVSSAILVRRVHFPSLQQLCPVQVVGPPRCSMAGLVPESSVLNSLRWQHRDDTHCCSAKASRPVEGELSIEECLVGHENSTAN